jgi:hypothetical protein
MNNIEFETKIRKKYTHLGRDSAVERVFCKCGVFLQNNADFK